MTITTDRHPKGIVLWVEDDPPERFVYERFVIEEEEGWALVWAGTLSKAVDCLSTQRVDALILDQEIRGEGSSVLSTTFCASWDTMSGRAGITWPPGTCATCSRSTWQAISCFPPS